MILTFVNIGQSESMFLKILFLVVGLFLIFLLAKSPWIDFQISRVIDYALKKYTDIDAKDYLHLLNLSGEYVVSEFNVEPNRWITNKTLGELRLRDEGILVLGIRHSNGTYQGVPDAGTVIKQGATLVLYGQKSHIKALKERTKGTAGNLKHEQASSKEKK